MRNDGDFNFVDVSEQTKTRDLPFGWGAVFEDLDKDGDQDLIFSNNYIDYPPHKLLKDDGTVLMNIDEGDHFTKIYEYKNSAFSQTPLMVDIDGDGVKDLYWVNVNGPGKIYKVPRNKNNFISLNFPSHPKYMNSKIIVKTPKKSYYQEFVTSGVGFASDQSKMITFGLGNESVVDQIHIRTIYGGDMTIENPEINSTIQIKDESINNDKIQNKNSALLDATQKIEGVDYSNLHNDVMADFKKLVNVRYYFKNDPKNDNLTIDDGRYGDLRY